MSNPFISVISSNFNGATYLPRLLDTLFSQRGVRLEIIVVDRHSTDESKSILDRYPEVKIVTEPPETGLVAGYAAGARHATADHLFFCNEDMWFDDECLSELVSHIDLTRRVASADPWQWTYDASVWIHGGTRFAPGTMRSRSPYPLRRNEFSVPLHPGTEIPFGCAGAIMIHRVAYEEAGGWDGTFFLDQEDVDLFIRMWQRGWKCVTVPTAKVYHAVNASNSKSIRGGKLMVGKRRYISNRSSVVIIAVKHFGVRALVLALLYWIEVHARHVILLRPKTSWWNMLTVREFGRRLVPALRYRAANAQLRRSKPGENLFTDPKFQLGDSHLP